MIAKTIADIEAALKTAEGIKESSTWLDAARINLAHAKELFESHLKYGDKAPAKAPAPATEPKA